MMSGFAFGSGGALMTLVMLLFWVFAIAGSVWLVLTLIRSQTPSQGGASSAQRVLAERLARGEIDAEEFRTRRAAIEEGAR